MSDEQELKPLSDKHRRVMDAYLLCWKKGDAYREVYGPKGDSGAATKLFKDPNFAAHLSARLDEVHLSADEALKLLADIARGDLGDFLKITKDGFELDLKKAKEKTRLIKRIKNKTTKINGPRIDREIHTEEIELYSALDALDKVLRVHGRYNDTLNLNTSGATVQPQTFVIPADKIAPSFTNVYRDIVHKRHTEYIFKGGRGSAKSSFVSEAFIYLLVNNPQVHGLALRQVADTLRDSVFAQLQWAVSELGLGDQFKSTLSPMEIEYLPTGQKIYFRGADDPGKIKSITPTFGYIGIVWFEELDQFRGQNAIRVVEQSIRGGDEIYYLKSFNPPATKSNWANKYLEIPKDTQYVHSSTYLDVPPEWLGRTWLDEAEHLKATNFEAYKNEYLGETTNDSGMVFANVKVRDITDEEISQFDYVLHGLDWGFYPDPASYGRMHYDAARRTLYIYGEGRHYKKSNEDLFNTLVEDSLIRKLEYGEGKKKEVSYPDLIIADSAEPKSVGDFKAYGANIRGAEKGPESRKYSYKWLQGLTAIIIDQKRAPYHAEEFLNCEYERTKDGEIISEYPAKNDHAIDDTRYATNLIWKRRGE
jgi:phage terminase, large subunit, PBSX family